MSNQPQKCIKYSKIFLKKMPKIGHYKFEKCSVSTQSFVSRKLRDIHNLDLRVQSVLKRLRDYSGELAYCNDLI